MQNCVGVWGGVGVPNHVCEETISIKINSRTQEVDSTDSINQNVLIQIAGRNIDTGLHKLWQPGSLAVRKWIENEKMKREWRENEEIERDSLSSFSLYFLPSISYIKICLILLQNVKYSTLVANFTKKT